MNELIKTFISVGARGSFSRAAEELFLTANGVKKRMNLLENETGLILFQRSNKGIQLTPAGQSLYNDCVRIEESYSLALQRAKNIQESHAQILRIGMMSTFADSFTVTPWGNLHSEERMKRIHIIYYGSGLKEMNRMFSDIGIHSDCCVDLYDERLAKKYNLQAEKISEYPLQIGFPESLHLTEEITLSELPDIPIALLAKRRSYVFDQIWNALADDKRLLRINDYSIKTFHDCYIKNAAILCTENLTNIFPFYTFVPLRFDRKVSYGIYYSELRPIETDYFFEALRKESQRS